MSVGEMFFDEKVRYLSEEEEIKDIQESPSIFLLIQQKLDLSFFP
jgi:hypothetical protein